MKTTGILGGVAAWIVMLATGAACAATLRVSAGSSLTEAFGTIAEIFEASHPGTEVELNFGGSQILRTQIEQ